MLRFRYIVRHHGLGIIHYNTSVTYKIRYLLNSGCVMWGMLFHCITMLKFMLCRVEVKAEHMSLSWEMASDSAVLTLVGSSFHHWGAKTVVTSLSELFCSQRWRFQPASWCRRAKCSRCSRCSRCSLNTHWLSNTGSFSVWRANL